MSRLSRRTFGAGAASAALVSQPVLAALPAPPLRRGVNAWPWFSLTREHPAPRTDFAWPPFQTQRPVPTPGDLRRLRDVGFDFIRLPVDPGPFLGANARDRMRLMEMLIDAVAAIQAADMAAIVNLHANAATHYWTPERM